MTHTWDHFASTRLPVACRGLCQDHRDLKGSELPLAGWGRIHPSGCRESSGQPSGLLCRDGDSRCRGCSGLRLEGPQKLPHPAGQLGAGSVHSSGTCSGGRLQVQRKASSGFFFLARPGLGGNGSSGAETGGNYPGECAALPSSSLYI